MEHPFRLISWWEMEKFSAHQFVSIGEQLAQLSAHLAKADETGLVIECLEAILAITGRQLQAIGCRYSAEAAKRLEKKLSPELSADVVDALAAELTCAIQTEMESHLFFWVPTHRAAWYSKDAETILGQECCQRFPSAQREVESGARCFALGQYTASAFHLTRATEAGMQAIARAISFSPPNQNWNLVFRQLGTEFALKPEQRPQHWQTHGPFLETVWADLRAVSKAWRNDIAHLVDVYDEDEAKNLLAVIPLFLRDMASQMDETGKLY